MLRRSARRWWKWGRLPPSSAGVSPGASRRCAKPSAQADAAVITARRSLVEAMGVRVSSFVDGPHATTPLPLPGAGAIPAVETLLADARMLRHDPLAVRRLRDAAAALSAAAVADLRRTVTLNVRAGMSTFYESPFFRFFPDEQQPIGVPGESQTPVGVGIVSWVWSNLQWCMETVRPRVADLRPAAGEPYGARPGGAGESVARAQRSHRAGSRSNHRR